MPKSNPPADQNRPQQKEMKIYQIAGKQYAIIGDELYEQLQLLPRVVRSCNSSGQVVTMPPTT
jgi:hypothetical protein